MRDIDTLLTHADLCVMCGQCLPHCPTYALEHNETESPRGRMSLVLALQRGELTNSDDVIAHLDNCLLCRACERVCPSKVPFAALMVAARARYGSALPPAGRLERWATEVLGSGRVAPLLRLYQHSGLQAVMRRGGLLGHGRLARMDSLLPQFGIGHRPPSAAADTPHGPVELFIGCTGESLDGATVQAAIALLERSGYAARLPTQPQCCGALALHEGRLDEAETLARRNMETLNGQSPIVSITSGCAAALADYGTWYGQEGGALAGRVVEIDAFLAASPPPAEPPTPLEEVVAVHIPCSQRNALRQPQALSELLARIPGVELRPLPEGCCGASGRNMIVHPEQADRLAAPYLEQLRASDTRIVVSSNIGCALHLAGAARREGWELEVVHPLVLLQRQYALADNGHPALARPERHG